MPLYLGPATARLVSFPLRQASIHQASIHQASIHQASIHQASIHQASIHQASIHQASIHQASIHQASIRQTRPWYGNASEQYARQKSIRQTRRWYGSASEQYARQNSVPRRIHIAGAGSIGRFIAHSLRSLADAPPVTLILHRPALLQAWNKSSRQIVLETDGHRVAQDGFDVELCLPPRRSHGARIEDSDQQPQEQNHEPIDNLIVTSKATAVVSAIDSVKHRLSPESTVCFLQNGMGIIDQVNKSLFPDPATRPNYIQGIVTHGVNAPIRDDSFFAVHAGHGTMALSLLPGHRQTDPNESFLFPTTSRYMLRTLTRIPVLAAVGLPPLEFIQQQLEKLAVNAVINPLTVLLDAPNGSILYNFAITRVMRLILAEASLVIRSLPELKGLPNIDHRFSPERLETLVVSVAHKTCNNTSSMLADVRKGRKTEVQWINGYLVRRGEELGHNCVCNYMMMQLVEGKHNMIERENLDQIPNLGPDPTGES